MLPNMLLDVIEDEGAPEFMDALLKQHEAEQRLRRISGESPHVEPPTVVQKEIVRRMLTRAEKEVELLKRVALD